MDRRVGPAPETDCAGINHSSPIQNQPRRPDRAIRVHHDLVTFQIRTDPPIYLIKSDIASAQLTARGSQMTYRIAMLRWANQGRFVMIHLVRFADRNVVQKHHLVV